MKKLFILFLLLSEYSFAQTYTWATTTGNYQSHGVGLAKDVFGNLVVAYAPLSFDYRNQANIVKYDANHVIVWRHEMKSFALDKINVCTDFLGNVYVTGGFQGTLLIDSIVRAYTSSDASMLLVKFNSQGVFQWIKYSTGDGAFGMALSTDAQNNVYVGGMYGGNNYFDSVFVTGVPVHYDFVAKYNSSGTLQWLKHGNSWGFSSQWGIGMKTDAVGNTYFTGTFYNWATFDSISISAYNNSTTDNIYIAKIDSSGNYVWVRSAGGIGQDAIYSDYGDGLALDGKGGVYITGFISSPTAYFGNIALTNTSGGSNYFLAKYDTSGNALWAINGGGSQGASFGVCADKLGNSYISRTGQFISKYDNFGNYLWSKDAAAENEVMIADDSGSIYITGYFQHAVSFDSISLSGGANQMFVAQLYDPPSITTNLPELKFDNGLSVYPNPASGIITLNYVSTKPKEAFTLTLNISNAIGQTVYSEVLKDVSASYTKQINLSFLPKGIYFLELQSNDPNTPQKSEVRKIVLQ